MTTINTFPETAQARSKRRNLGIGALILTLPCLGCGIWLIPSEVALSGWSGLLIGVLLFIVGLHGVLSKPLLTIDDDRMVVSGYFLPNSNMNLPFSEITHAKLMGIAPSQSLFFSTTGKPRVIGSSSFERFEDILKIVGERMEQLGHPVEIVQPSKPV
jgi:hypothetical protein